MRIKCMHFHLHKCIENASLLNLKTINLRDTITIGLYFQINHKTYIESNSHGLVQSAKKLTMRLHYTIAHEKTKQTNQHRLRLFQMQLSEHS